MSFGFLVHFSDSINRGFEEWGNIMRKKYNKNTEYREKD